MGKLIFSRICDIFTSFNRRADIGLSGSECSESNIRAFHPPNQTELALNIYYSRLLWPDLKILPQDYLYSLSQNQWHSFFLEQYSNCELLN